jgi:hypothetical protein
MKSVSFRSISEWESALLTLPENSFFTLLRSVFGNIKTPFNKQKLIHDLTAFLSKKEIQETIKNYIDEDDHRVIAAIGILEEPFPGELESFFGGEYSYADLHSIVLNLEERLIVYRFKDEGKSRLALNPVLAPVLKPFAENINILFPSSKIADPENAERKKSPWGASLLACLISFVYDQHDLFKNQGGVKKKSLDDCKRIFPTIKLEPLLGTFRALGLLQLDEMGKHHIDENRLDQLTELSEYERRIYLAAAMMVFYEQDENFWQYFNKNRILTTTKELHSFLQSLNTDRTYPKSTMHKMFEIQESKGKDFFFKKATTKNNGRAELVFKVLQMFNLIEKTEKDSWKIIPVDNHLDNSFEEKNNSIKYISMDSPNSFIVFPEITFAKAMQLARFSSVLETGTTTRFALTKDSAVRAYQLGMTGEEIIEVLKNFSGTHIDQNIIWQLKDWEKRYSEVALNTGVVLSLSKDRLYLANTEPLASMIAAVLAPGIFLLNVDEEDDAANALEKAGVDIIARNTNQRKQKNIRLEKKTSFFLKLDTSSNRNLLSIKGEQNNHQSDIINIDDEKSDEQKDHFRTVLAKMKIAKDQRDELSARIERRLILSDEQMDGSSVKYEKLEARGLDYVGKHNIAKQAIASGALLEVVWSDEQGIVQRIFDVPCNIDKVNGEAVLVMHTEKNESNQDGLIRIALGRISLLRRIKQSIFGE